jgi:hypothetical protein
VPRPAGDHRRPARGGKWRLCRGGSRGGRGQREGARGGRSSRRQGSLTVGRLAVAGHVTEGGAEWG